MGDEAAVYADKAYAKASRREELARGGVFYGVMHKATPSHPLSPWQELLNRWRAGANVRRPPRPSAFPCHSRMPGASELPMPGPEIGLDSIPEHYFFEND